jgi:hypothetical protein
MSIALKALAAALLIQFAAVACSNGTNMSGGSKDEKKKETAKTEDARETETNRPEQSDNGADADDDDSDLSVIPPEVVSAAFLTCSTADTGTTPSEGDVHLGCVIKDEKGEKLTVVTKNEDWTLKSGSGDDVSYEDIEVPAGSQYHKIYGLTQATYEAGVNPEVRVKASNDEVIPVKRKGKVSINGKEVQ